MAPPETVCRAGALARITDHLTVRQGQLVLHGTADDIGGHPGANSRAPLTATTTSAGVTTPSNPAGPNRCPIADAATITAASTSRQPQPSPSGIITSIPVPTATVRNHVLIDSRRCPARRSQPRTVDGGTCSRAAIPRCPTPSARADSAIQTRSAAYALRNSMVTGNNT